MVQRRQWWPCVSPHPRCLPSPAFGWLWRVSRAVTAASVSLPQPHSASRRLLLICGHQLEKHPRGPPSSNQGVPEPPEGTRAGYSVGMGPHPAWGKERRWHLILGDLQKPPGGGPGHPAMGGPTGAGAGTNDIPRSLPASAILWPWGAATLEQVPSYVGIPALGGFRALAGEDLNPQVLCLQAAWREMEGTGW